MYVMTQGLHLVARAFLFIYSHSSYFDSAWVSHSTICPFKYPPLVPSPLHATRSSSQSKLPSCPCPPCSNSHPALVYAEQTEWRVMFTWHFILPRPPCSNCHRCSPLVPATPRCSNSHSLTNRCAHLPSFQQRAPWARFCLPPILQQLASPPSLPPSLPCNETQILRCCCAFKNKIPFW